MTKTRFTAADVRAMVRDLRSSVLGLRVANVYSLLDQKVGGTVSFFLRSTVYNDEYVRTAPRKTRNDPWGG